MARPRQALGTHGSITTRGYVVDDNGQTVPAKDGQRPSKWRGETRYRDPAGKTHRVQRWAKTRAAAETAVKAACAGWQAPSSGVAGGLKGTTSVEDAARYWLSHEVERSDRADSTKAQYKDNVARYIDGSDIAALSLREANSVAVLEGFLQGIADRNGEGAAKTARKLISGTFGLAVRHGALTANASREVRPAKRSEAKPSHHDTSRAFTREERAHLLAVADADPREASQDVADLLYFLAGTGVRLGEALHSTSWADWDEAASTIRVRGTKTRAADRTLTLPDWLAERLRQRAARYGTEGLVFGVTRYPSKIGRPRNKRNVTRLIQSRMEGAGLSWASSHSLRRTAASWMDESGAPLAEIANQLGHADVTTTAGYLGRRVAPTRAAEVL